MAICILLSVLFSLPSISDNAAITLLKDYISGISCSLLVVLVTTYLQFRHEQNCKLASLLAKLRFFFFDYLDMVGVLDPYEKTHPQLWSFYHDKIEKSVDEILTDTVEIEWFSKKKSEQIAKLQKQMLGIKITITKLHGKTNEKILETIIELPEIKEIKDSTMLIAEADSYSYIRTEVTKDYEEAKKLIEMYQAIRSSNDIANANSEK